MAKSKDKDEAQAPETEQGDDWADARDFAQARADERTKAAKEAEKAAAKESKEK